MSVLDYILNCTGKFYISLESQQAIKNQTNNKKNPTKQQNLPRGWQLIATMEQYCSKSLIFFIDFIPFCIDHAFSLLDTNTWFFAFNFGYKMY